MPTPAAPCSESVQSASSAERPSKQDDPEFLAIGYSQFSIANLTALYNSTFAQGFSNDERQAAVCALLRHNAHADGAHFQSRVKGGLHPAYVGFNPSMTDNKARTLSNEELVGAALEDVFDAVTMQDRLDGGITVMLHCARVKSTSTQTADEVTVDLYVTPRELRKSPECIGSDIAVLVQAFFQEFALPHFQCFNKHCNLEIITPPTNTSQGSSINVDGPQYLPFPVSPASSRIQCSAQDPSQFNAPANTQADGTLSAAIHWVKEISNRTNVPPSSPQKPQSIQRRHLAEVHPPLRVTEQMLSAAELPAHSTSIFSTNPTIFGPMLISIRPNTDAVLDHFKISNKVLPQLRKLISTARSSHWEAVLRSPQWNLTYEQAVNIS
ncbi:hypothetical protein PISMIDRAFT_17704 [Pisolithus microcarpus 441]|uniref:Unplaced genomic scaffold scaffold_287, whole genome shotgun sequence n=1 Tax=Pisolithus microcarpus 441 TaxID=765257 RepID=A0A0C9YAD2_9AGAM|nr:hypothetical protein PISMIDRAFT_17704 [Pisolithus microcarpus 441]